MRQLTLRGFDPPLERALRSLASEQSISLNRAALLLLRRGAGLPDPGPELQGDDTRRIGPSLDAFIGVWSIEDERELLDAVGDLDSLDEDLWR